MIALSNECLRKNTKEIFINDDVEKIYINVDKARLISVESIGEKVKQKDPRPKRLRIRTNP